MAKRDGTGPMGMGSNTGRGMGRGMGLGCRGGFGCNGFNNTMSPVNQSYLLAEEKAILENRLNIINNQLNTTQEDK